MKHSELYTVLDERLLAFERRIEEHMERQLAVFAGQIMRHVHSSVAEVRQEVKEHSNTLATIMDGVAKRISDDEQERAALAVVQDRHDVWIKLLANKTATKLLPEP